MNRELTYRLGGTRYEVEATLKGKLEPGARFLIKAHFCEVLERKKNWSLNSIYAKTF